MTPKQSPLLDAERSLDSGNGRTHFHGDACPGGHVGRIAFFVPGKPEPAGSKRALPFGGKPGMRPIVVDANAKAKPWQAVVRSYALEAKKGDAWTGPVLLSLRFTLRRPKSHYRTGKHAGELRADAPRWHSSKPDRLKLARAVEDAIAGVLVRDDAQTASGPVSKEYGDIEGVEIELEPLEESAAAARASA